MRLKAEFLAVLLGWLGNVFIMFHCLCRYKGFKSSVAAALGQYGGGVYFKIVYSCAIY